MQYYDLGGHYRTGKAECEHRRTAVKIDSFFMVCSLMNWFPELRPRKARKSLPMHGNPAPPRQLSQEFARLTKSAGLKVSYHGLRHSHLTALMASGINPKVICERAGHASVATTLDLYGHVMPGMQEAVAQGVDAAIRTALEH